VAGAQRSGIIGAAQRVERIGRDASRVSDPGMVRPQRSFMGGESGFAQSQCVAGIPGGEPQAGQIVTSTICVGMLGLELLTDRQRALAERPRARKAALVLQQQGEVVEALPRKWMLGSEHFLADCQCAFMKQPRPARSPCA
jgi:hypothetical protein